MKTKTVVGLIILVFVISCVQRKSKIESKNKINKVELPHFESGLTISNGINRGTNYTDSLGNDFNLRYIPITIANDSTIPIRIEIVFSNPYKYSQVDSKESFKLIPLPKEWAQEGIGITDEMVNELPIFIEKPILNKTIEPGGKIILGIGTLYPRPSTTSGVLPNALFIPGDGDTFQVCNWQMDKNQSSNTIMLLGLKLRFGDNCTVISCGEISYPEK